MVRNKAQTLDAIAVKSAEDFGKNSINSVTYEEFFQNSPEITKTFASLQTSIGPNAELNKKLVEY